jgi:hypothetical protein
MTGVGEVLALARRFAAVSMRASLRAPGDGELLEVLLV